MKNSKNPKKDLNTIISNIEEELESENYHSIIKCPRLIADAILKVTEDDAITLKIMVEIINSGVFDL